MGMMTKLREKTGVLLWILVISFGLIWTLQDSGAFEQTGGQITDIIVVDGDPISYEEYQRAINNQVQALEQQSGRAVTPQQRDMVENQVYEALINDRLRQRLMDRLGVQVTRQELVDMVLGENPDPFIRANFADETGQIDRQQLELAIQNLEQQQWIQVEEYLRSKRRGEKLQSLIAASVRVSDQDVLDAYQRENTTYGAEYIALPLASLPNDSVAISDGDLRDFYDENREDYKQQRTISFQYATLPKTAAAEDTTQVFSTLEDVKSRLASAENDSLFVARSASTAPFSGEYRRRDELPPALAEVVFSDLEPGRTVGPIAAGGEAHVAKIMDVQEAESPVVQASHILIRSGSDADAARERAQELLGQLRDGADFAQLARQNSQDPGSAVRGGDLGWFTRDRMVEPFSEAAFDASVGEVVGPVETQFGYHIIKVTGKSDQAVQLAQVSYPIEPAVATLDERKERLEDIAYYSQDGGDFAQEARNQGLQLQQVQVEADQSTIPGIGVSSELSSFLEESEAGATTDLVELDDRYLVAHVTEVTPEGYRSFEEVEAEIRPQVLVQQKRQILGERLRSAIASNGFDQAASALRTRKRVASNLQGATPTIPGIGRSASFGGAAFALETGTVSPVIEGDNAVFALRLTDKAMPTAVPEAEKTTLRQQMLQQRRSQMMQEWITALRDQAEIVDNRSQLPS